jgi:serine/threonine-protein kinase
VIGSLRNPHIVRIIDIDTEEGLNYMVMDYIEGGTLSEYLKARQLLEVHEALRVGAQVASALAYAHDQGVIHRDIKPSNIMFTDDTHSQAVLTDFGLARMCFDHVAGLTIPGAMVGTPTYMSPEALRGEVCDERADIYSLGVVLYELVTGKPPYVANTPYSMMVKQTTEPLPSPRTLNPALPDAVEQLLLKALAKEPSDRIQSAAEFAYAIKSAHATLRNGSATQAQARPTAPVPIAEVQAEKQPSRNLLALILAACAVGLVTLLTAGLLMSF